MTIILSDVTLYPILEKWPCCYSAYRGLDTMPDVALSSQLRGRGLQGHPFVLTICLCWDAMTLLHFYQQTL